MDDTACMIQLLWLCKIANSSKLDVQIVVWYNFWKIGWVIFPRTCMEEIDNYISRLAILTCSEEKSGSMNRI